MEFSSIYQYINLINQLFNYMSKVDLSTSSDNNQSFYPNGSQNQARLIKIIHSLELELGYQAVALKKAEKMMNLMQSQNQALAKQNQSYKDKCKQLELKVVKYQNWINHNNCIYVSDRDIECKSPSIKNKTGIRQSQNFQLNCEMVSLGKNSFKSYGNIATCAETPMILSNNQSICASTSKSNRNTVRNVKQVGQPIKYDTIDSITISQSLNGNRLQQKRKKKVVQNQNINPNRNSGRATSPSPALSPLKNAPKTLSFIPFQQLQIKTKWN